jgi:hypothetical protein
LSSSGGGSEGCHFAGWSSRRTSGFDQPSCMSCPVDDRVLNFCQPFNIRVHGHSPLWAGLIPGRPLPVVNGLPLPDGALPARRPMLARVKRSFRSRSRSKRLSSAPRSRLDAKGAPADWIDLHDAPVAELADAVRQTRLRLESVRLLCCVV